MSCSQTRSDLHHDRTQMKIVSLNIRHGGGKRIPRILEWLAQEEADFILLCEWRLNPAGLALEQALKIRGYQTSGYARSEAENGILIASKKTHHTSRLTPSHAAKGELIKVTCDSVVLICGYFPQKNDKKPFFEVAITELSLGESPSLLIGDLNTGKNDVDLEEGATPFFCANEFNDLEVNAGSQDLWRLCHGKSAKEWSWRSSKNGFRIDHAFGNSALTTAFPKLFCRYEHSTRLEGISDHSALLVEL